MVLNNLEAIKMHQTIRVPDDSNLFVIGDVHGKLDNLCAALSKVGFVFGKDYLVCCGDLIDRGDQNHQVVNAFLEKPNWYTVLGNHDLFPITEDFHLWTWNGGDWALDDGTIYQEGGRYKVNHDFWMKMIKHPLIMTVEHREKRYGIVHAGMPYTGAIGKFISNDWNYMEKALNTFGTQAIEAFVWDRSLIDDINMGRAIPPAINVDKVFSGHTVIKEPVISGNRVYLDLGSVHYGKYAIYNTNEDKVQVVQL